ncbi:hypothetical protein [Streptomyces sp. NPDC057253]|uniref:hypothetical protein n=1 Tax=Streptomyces sp. NPDC057253 TaxID=3346069 RepID=UPI003628FF8E
MLHIPNKDARFIRETCGPEIIDVLEEQAAEHAWTDLYLHRPEWTAQGRSYTDAVLLAVEVAPPAQQLILKIVPAGAAGREPAATAAAAEAVETFTDLHLVTQPFDPVPLPDGRTLMFQKVAGDSLQSTTTVGGLDGQHRARVVEHLIRGLLSCWNAEVLKLAVPEPVKVSAFLREELNGVWQGDGSLQAWGRSLGVLDPAPPWLYSDGMRLPNPYLMVKGGSALPDPELRVLRGLGHGDLHLDNVLVPQMEGTVQAEAYRLIDLCTFSARADLGGDAATVLLSALIPFVEHELPPDQRHALLRFIVAPHATHGAYIVPRAKTLVQAVTVTAQREMSHWRDSWDAQFLLSLMARALMFTTYTEIGVAGRGWLVRLAAHAGGELLARTARRQGGQAWPPPLEPGRDSFTTTQFSAVGVAGSRGSAGFVPDQEPQRRRWETDSGVRDERAVLGFGPDHTVVVVDGQGRVRRWSVGGDSLPGAEGRPARIRVGHQALVSSLTHSLVTAWPKELEILRFPQDAGVFRSDPVHFDGGENFLVTSGGDVFATHDRKSLTVRSFEDGSVVERVPCPASLAASAVSLDASVIALARSQEVFIHRRGRPTLQRSMANSMPYFRTGLLRKFSSLVGPGCQLAVSPSGSHVGCVTFEEVLVWSTEDGREAYRRKLTDREAREALGGEGMRLLCTETGTLFCLKRGRLSCPTIDGGIQLRQSGRYVDVAISRDGRLMAMLGSEGRLEVWDL